MAETGEINSVSTVWPTGDRGQGFQGYNRRRPSGQRRQHGEHGSQRGGDDAQQQDDGKSDSGIDEYV